MTGILDNGFGPATNALDSVDHKVGFVAGLGAYLDAGSAANQMLNLPFTCRNTKHARYGHLLIIMWRDDGLALFDSTAQEWVWYGH